MKLNTVAPVAYREALPDGEAAGSPVVLVHGFPQSSLMWSPLMEALADAGRRCLAPDLYALGDSREFGAATFEHSLERFDQWVEGLGLGSFALVVHDWGGFIGLAWAAANPARIEALVISDTGFFADGKWHGMAEALRGDQGEELIAALDRAGFAGLLNSGGDTLAEAAVDAYWAPFAEGRGQRATLEFYRSMDFAKLAPYTERLAALDVPALLLWGERDPFAPLAGARRFERELARAELVGLDAGHFVFDEQPERTVAEVVAFLGRD